MGMSSKFATVSWVRRAVTSDGVMLQAALMYVKDESQDVCRLVQDSAQKVCTAGGSMQCSLYYLVCLTAMCLGQHAEQDQAEQANMML